MIPLEHVCLIQGGLGIQLLLKWTSSWSAAVHMSCFNLGTCELWFVGMVVVLKGQQTVVELLVTQG